MKIILTSSDGRGVVKALGLVSAAMLLSVSVGNVEKEEELVMCVYVSAALAGDSLSIAFIANGLPARLDDADTFMKRPFCSLGAWIVPAGARRLLLDRVPSLPSCGASSVRRRRRLVRVDVDGDWDAGAAAASGAPVSA